MEAGPTTKPTQVDPKQPHRGLHGDELIVLDGHQQRISIVVPTLSREQALQAVPRGLRRSNPT